MNDVNKIIQEISDINDKVNEIIPGERSGPDYECEKTRLNNQVVGNGPDHDDPNHDRIIPVINENLKNIREKIRCMLDRTGTIRKKLDPSDIKFLINTDERIYNERTLNNKVDKYENKYPVPPNANSPLIVGKGPIKKNL